MKKAANKVVKKTAKKAVPKKSVSVSRKTSDQENAPTTTGSLNPEQQKAVDHRGGPLLIIAGAGTGKTRTLVHRVAKLIEDGADPGRILLLTFTRRAASEMFHRVGELLKQKSGKADVTNRGIWGGTFHATAARLLRMYGLAIGLPRDFTIIDRADSEDLVGTIRAEFGFDKSDLKFPKKGTCMTIFSLHANSRLPIDKIVAQRFPWLKSHVKKLVEVYKQYEKRKKAAATLDYDDLLTWWLKLMENKEAGPKIVERFDHVLVDEYQDTNIVQSDILQKLCPKGKNLTVVGDDAQSIYSFRAATVRNILDFPKQFPGTKTIKIEQNYRSTPNILETTNRVIGQAREGFKKNLRSENPAGPKPIHLTCYGDSNQADYVVKEILRLRDKEGIPLNKQAVLFRASYHSLNLETELARKKITFVKHGGLKFVESAHIKDLMSFLRFAENRRDEVAGVRALSLLPGIGNKKALDLAAGFAAFDDPAAGVAQWKAWKPPKATTAIWPLFLKFFEELLSGKQPLAKQLDATLKFYKPILEEKYDEYKNRLADLEQLQEIAARFKDRGEMLTDLTLDPPTSTDELPDKKKKKEKPENILTLSTIHSAKGLEWDAVFVIHASDGFIPSDKATDTEGIEEELRLFYVALTRAAKRLYICSPRYFFNRFNSWSDDDGYRDVSRFIDKDVKKTLQSVNDR